MLVPLGSSFSICAPISAVSCAAVTAGTSSRSLALLIADACLLSADVIGLLRGCIPVGTLLLLLLPLLAAAGSDLSAECTADMAGRWLPMRAKREPAAAATELRFLCALLSSPPPAAEDAAAGFVFVLAMPPADKAASAMLPGDRGSPPLLLNIASFSTGPSVYDVTASFASAAALAVSES
jgi:hypothetical protein